MKWEWKDEKFVQAEEERDMCPECRCGPREEHHPDCKYEFVPFHQLEECEQECVLPKHLQMWMFDQFADVALEHLICLLDDYRNDIIELGRERMAQGFKTYGSKMYGWGNGKRLENILEELADAVVYGTSGDF